MHGDRLPFLTCLFQLFTGVRAFLWQLLTPSGWCKRSRLLTMTPHHRGVKRDCSASSSFCSLRIERSFSLCSPTGSGRPASNPPPGPDRGSACSLRLSLRRTEQTLKGNFQTSNAAAVSAVFALGAPAGRLRLDLRPRHLIFVIAPPRFMVRSSETPLCAEKRAICINQQRGCRARVIRSVNPTQVTT